MRFRFTLLRFELVAEKPTPPEEPHPQGDTYTTTERADQPIGFTLPEDRE